MGAAHFGVNIFLYTPDGAYIPPYGFASGGPLKSDAKGNYYMSAGGVLAKHGPEREAPSFQVGTASPLTGFNRDPSTGEIYQDTGTDVAHYAAGCPTEAGPCDPLDSFGTGNLSGGAGLAVSGATHAVYVANSSAGNVAVFGDARPIVTTGPQTGGTESTAVISGHIDPVGRGDITACYFEYGPDSEYGHTVPCEPDPAASPPGSNFTGPTDVAATVGGFSSGTRNHYRLVAVNAAGGTAAGADELLSSTQPPVIDGVVAEHLTATTADIEAQVNPGALNATYRVEYGTTTEYGSTAPVPAGTLSASISAQAVEVHLEGLTPRRVYHYRVVATNADGTTTVADHTFNFYPAGMPQLERPPADPDQLPARLPRLRAGLSRQRRRHPALPGRPQHRLREQPGALQLHRTVGDDSGSGRKPEQQHGRSVRRHPHAHRLGEQVRRPSRRTNSRPAVDRPRASLRSSTTSTGPEPKRSAITGTVDMKRGSAIRSSGRTKFRPVC